ncbi:unnamed protein product [Linum trigynum]|uniref:Uncharacterized protein n=1 Tax=Linum trigynum TaxID=586398 RepID=A0AAV2GPV2_9ROSI
MTIEAVGTGKGIRIYEKKNDENDGQSSMGDYGLFLVFILQIHTRARPVDSVTLANSPGLAGLTGIGQVCPSPGGSLAGPLAPIFMDGSGQSGPTLG